MFFSQYLVGRLFFLTFWRNMVKDINSLWTLNIPFSVAFQACVAHTQMCLDQGVRHPKHSRLLVSPHLVFCKAWIITAKVPLLIILIIVSQTYLRGRDVLAPYFRYLIQLGKSNQCCFIPIWLSLHLSL